MKHVLVKLAAQAAAVVVAADLNVAVVAAVVAEDLVDSTVAVAAGIAVIEATVAAAEIAVAASSLPLFYRVRIPNFYEESA
jgi:hypothetical protein